MWNYLKYMNKALINQIYEFSYKYLINISSKIISKEEIDDFINNPDVTNCNSLEGAYELLLVILQDFQMFPSVIKYKERSNYIKQQINFPDIKYIAQLDPISLSNKFKTKFGSKGIKCWINYCKGIVSGAKFLSSFNDYNEFIKMCDLFNKNDMTREAFALLLKDKIDNMGFAIACNWLKELGYYDYIKPDVHMKDICQALELIDDSRDDLDCFEAMSEIAKAAGVRPYTIDKVWWLICSGDFYRYDKKNKTPNLKKNFIEALKKKFL